MTIGGVIIRPNHIEGLFLRPPNVNAFEMLQASTLVRDAERNLLVGACLISLQRSNTRPDNPYACISMIGVRPEYCRQGLATRMVRNALSVLHGHRPILKFGVAAGNPAEAFYQNLGFLAGPAHYVLLMPPRRTAGVEENRPQQPGRGDAEDRAPHP